MTSAKNQTRSLPSAADFAKAATAATAVRSADGPCTGTVLDLDHDAYASAYINLARDSAYVERRRDHLRSCGYLPAPGFEVYGVKQAEVWVMPRDLYLQRNAAKRRDLERRVRDGYLSDSATLLPHVLKPKGAS